MDDELAFSKGAPFSNATDAIDTPTNLRSLELDSKRNSNTSIDDIILKAIPFKVVMIGDKDVGKTCLICRFTKGTY